MGEGYSIGRRQTTAGPAVVRSMSMLQAGEMVAGRYRLIAPLAQGGMGAVWRARHAELETEVALKVMLAPVAGSSSGEKRFRREARAAAKLNSPHIVRVHDFGLHEGQPYLAMELLQGEDLAQRLESGPPPLEETSGILRAVARAMDLAHQHGIIHRDLKPANVFLARQGADVVVKVLDFGVAKVEGGEPSTASTTGAGVVGSPAYMSPEQVWGEPVSPKSDVWSLGVIAAELVLGENPFERGALAKVFQAIVSDDLPRPCELRPDLPPSLAPFFERALARSPEERFATASALAEGFAQAISEGGGADSVGPTTEKPTTEGTVAATPSRALRAVDPHATTIGGVPAVASPRTRHAPYVAGAIALTATLIGAAAFLLTLPSPQPPQPATDGSASVPARETTASAPVAPLLPSASSVPSSLAAVERSRAVESTTALRSNDGAWSKPAARLPKPSASVSLPQAPPSATTYDNKFGLPVKQPTSKR